MKTYALLAVLSLFLLTGCDDSDAPPAPADTPTPTTTPTVSTPTPTAIPATATTTATPTQGPGPSIVFFGLLRADNTLLEPIDSDPEGRPIYLRPQGSGFVIVVEAKRGRDNRNPGFSTLDSDPANASLRPDLQILTNHALGNGSTAVCDDRLPLFGGVPAVDPPVFDGSQATADALNDFGCRFINGGGEYVGRFTTEACILGQDGEYRFANAQTTVQFCSLISAPLAFPHGDTILTARVRDVASTLGSPQQIVVRVGTP